MRRWSMKLTHTHAWKMLGQHIPKLHQYNAVLEHELEVLEDPLHCLATKHGVVLEDAMTTSMVVLNNYHTMQHDT